jgi:hypothetical protein
MRVAVSFNALLGMSKLELRNISPLTVRSLCEARTHNLKRRNEA